ncbi:hypothetical protein Tco_0276438 [Tanacetum coccineum]
MVFAKSANQGNYPITTKGNPSQVSREENDSVNTFYSFSSSLDGGFSSQERCRRAEIFCSYFITDERHQILAAAKSIGAILWLSILLRQADRIWHFPPSKSYGSEKLIITGTIVITLQKRILKDGIGQSFEFQRRENDFTWKKYSFHGSLISQRGDKQVELEGDLGMGSLLITKTITIPQATTGSPIWSLVGPPEEDTASGSDCFHITFRVSNGCCLEEGVGVCVEGEPEPEGVVDGERSFGKVELEKSSGWLIRCCSRKTERSNIVCNQLRSETNYCSATSDETAEGKEFVTHLWKQWPCFVIDEL